MSKVYAVACYWMMNATVFVRADSKQEACDHMLRPDVPLPTVQGFYLSDSFEADPDATEEVSADMLEEVEEDELILDATEDTDLELEAALKDMEHARKCRALRENLDETSKP